jgi:hypothetical protein
MRAGASAFEHSASLGSVIESTERQIQNLREALHALARRQRSFEAGGEGERRAAERLQQVLLDFGTQAWFLLVDRRWPGTRRANLDLILVGPPGVVLIDAKSWAEPSIRGGSLYRGQENVDDEVDKSRRSADAVAEVLAGVGLAPVGVRPVILLVNRKHPAVDLGGVLVLGEESLSSELVRLGGRLDAVQVAQVVEAIDKQCPPAAGAVSAPPTRAVRRPAATEPSVPARADALIEIENIWDAALDAAAREPIESWMTWLHPNQAQLITRRYSGPARIRGAAGTGKTVVALHRARELAKRPGARVLVTSFVRTLPHVHESLFTRLAPDLAGRVEFRSVHSWASRLLRSRGTVISVSSDVAHAAFETAWNDVGAPGALGASTLPKEYWNEEISSVIKGRGLTDVADYLVLQRVGRRTAVREDQRRAVWALYLAYQENLQMAGAHDWEDLLLLALESVRRAPVSPAYTAVVVDEVQDLTCVGLRLLHALVGDAPDGLLLVGDGQQSVYPGGFALPEAGVTVAGRATVLDRNYRNRREIVQAAFEVVSGDLYDDFDADPISGVRDVEIDRDGGIVVRSVTANPSNQERELVRALRAAAESGVRTGDMAVLVPDNLGARRWVAALSSAGVPAALLEDYDGTTSDAVKVGTYHRAKGLEFACVFVPDHDRAVGKRREGESGDAYRERAELEHRRLFVAMTRARDRLWLGSCAPNGATRTRPTDPGRSREWRPPASRHPRDPAAASD